MLLRIEHITKSYRPPFRRGAVVRANDAISLGIEGGQVFGLLGHNGAGKTTLVNQVVGLLRPDAGHIQIDGRDAVSDPAYARQVCSLQPQAQLPINGLSPRQAIEILGRLRGGDGHAVRERRAQLVEALDIGSWLDIDGERLSGGVKRLVSFIMAAVVPGRVVILDEPTNDVDPVRRRLLWAQVRALADEGCAVLLVTHNVLEAERAVDRLAILDRGRVVAEGAPGKLKEGLGSELRLELTLEPGAASPVPAPFVERYLPNGTRVVAILPTTLAGDGVAWAESLRQRHIVTEYALTPVSLEDAYVSLVGHGALSTQASAGSSTKFAHGKEVSGAHAA